jgi:hypothetical protein
MGRKVDHYEEVDNYEEVDVRKLTTMRVPSIRPFEDSHSSACTQARMHLLSPLPLSLARARSRAGNTGCEKTHDLVEG